MTQSREIGEIDYAELNEPSEGFTGNEIINYLLLQPFYTSNTTTLRLNLEISLPVKGLFA